MARDLREIFAAIKIASDLERMCDYAANVAKRAIALNQWPPVRPVYALPRMARLARGAGQGMIDAYVARDADKALCSVDARRRARRDVASLFRELLTYMMEDPRNIGPSTHLMFMAKNIERIGDHATNVAEDLYSLVHGTPMTKGGRRATRRSSRSSVAGRR